MKIALIICVSVLVLFFISLYLLFVFTFYSGKKRKRDPYYGTYGEETKIKKLSRDCIDLAVAMKYEKVSVKSRDGLLLTGKYYAVKEGAPIQIQFHGYRSVALHDFSGGSVEAVKTGHNVLLVDQRAHGDSEGRVISFGINERYDVLSWIDFALERFEADTEIILAGISMGAATVLMASELNLPENVKGIIADCPYSSPAEIIKKVSRDMKIPPMLSYPLIKLSARLFGGFNLEESSSVGALRNAKIPVLLIHGEGDNFVPCDMSRDIARVNSRVRLVTFREAGHGLSYIYDKDGYTEELNEFYKTVLKQEENKNA